MPTSRVIRYYSMSKANLAALLVPPFPATDWSWQGRGPDGLLSIRHADVNTPNNPVPNMTRTQERYTLYRLEEVRAIAFPAISPGVLQNTTLAFTATDVQFFLNVEE